MMKRFLFGMFLLVLSNTAWAQNIPSTVTTQTSSTIAVTDTFQAVPVTGSRKGCLIQNQGSNVMYVFFGPIGNATKAKSFQIQAPQSGPFIQGGTVSCFLGGPFIVQDDVSITGTSTESFVYSVSR